MADKSSVEKLRSKLYSREAGPEVDLTARTPLRPEDEQAGRQTFADVHAPPAARMPPPPAPSAPLAAMLRRSRTKKHSFAFYFLWVSFLFFVAAAGFAAFVFFGGGNTISPQNIDVQIVAPPLIDSGKGASVEFIITNRNTTPLKNADIVVDYPAGTRDPSDPTKELPRDRINVGDIAAGAQAKETSSAVFFGAEGSQEQITATLEYQITGSNSIFVKAANVLFTIGSAPLSLSVNAPSEAISGQPFSMDLTVTSNATTPISTVAVEAQYPFGFAVNSASPSADVGNTLWRLGTLAVGASQTIHLTGTLTGVDGEVRVFHFLVGSESDPTETTLSVPLLSVPQTVTVRKPFVSGAITLDNQTGATIPEPLGKQVQGTVTWQNNLTESVSDLTLTLSLAGAALDPSSVNVPNGFYDSSKSQIVWNSQQNAELADVAPGATGQFSFYFSTLAPSAGTFMNPSLNLNLTVQATRMGGTGAPETVSSAAQTTVALASNASLTAQALHFTGPSAGTGPMPPVVGQETTYTVLWTVKNSSNIIAGSQVSATLPPYVTFAGVNGGADITYDNASRTVTWNMGDIKAGVGYSAPALQASFQVALTPSVSQVGQSPQLTSDATFTGQDRFALATVTTGAPAVTTLLASDPGFQHGMDVVVTK